MIRHICPATSRFFAIRTIPLVAAAVSVAAVSSLPRRAFAQSTPTPPAAPAQQPTPQAQAPTAAAPTSSPKITLSAEPAPRKIVFDAQPASTGNNRSYHYHDGFYLRAGLNYGPGWGGLTLGEEDQTQIDYSGGLLDFNLLIAGTPSPGFSVGGGLLLGTFLQPNMDSNGDEVATSNVGYLLLGPFVDGYFSPNGGWHMGALAGVAGLGKTPHTNRAAGFGGSVWLGYDAWVGADWALGGNVRFTAAAASGDRPLDFSASAMAISLGFSALYH